MSGPRAWQFDRRPRTSTAASSRSAVAAKAADVSPAAAVSCISARGAALLLAAGAANAWAVLLQRRQRQPRTWSRLCHPSRRAGTLSIGDALNLAIIEEMLRDPKTTIHAEDLQAGSSYNIPKLTQQTFRTLRAADEIIVLSVPRAQRRKDYVACCCCGTA